MFNNICEALHRELDMLDEKYANGSQLNNQDLEHIDKMMHALKSIATYEAMKGDSEYGFSRRMSRSSRYSRDGYDHPFNHGVPDGYERSPRY